MNCTAAKQKLSLAALFIGLSFSGPAAAGPGSDGILTKLEENCMQRRTHADQKATTEFVIDVLRAYEFEVKKEPTPKYIVQASKIHLAELQLDKIQCVTNYLSGYLGALPKDVSASKLEKNERSRVVINQLSLYRGLKKTELELMVSRKNCVHVTPDEQVKCIENLNAKYAQEVSMFSAIDSFLELYYSEIDAKKDFYLSATALGYKTEMAARRRLEELRNPVAQTPPAANFAPGTVTQ